MNYKCTLIIALLLVLIGCSVTNQSNGDTNHPFQIGKPYFIRTVTMNLIGVLESVDNTELVVSKCSWIADTGRFSDAIRKGSLKEVEPFNFDENVIVGRGSIVDATVWIHHIPTKQQ